MTTETLNNNSSNLAALFGVEDMSAAEQEVFFQEVGALVLESSLLRFTAQLSAAKKIALEHYLETEPEPVAIINHMVQHYPDFEQTLDEEMAAFRAESEAVLG